MKKDIAHRHYTEYLRSQGKSVTPERLEILDEILELSAHFKIDDIILKVTNSETKISRATVYRSIKTIEEAGLIKYLRSINDEKIYEVVEEHHDHMICEICGNIIEFHNKKLESLQNSICEQQGFTANRHTMKIFGVCKSCSSE